MGSPAVPHTVGGRRLGGRYELGDRLGRGGTAEVHAAHDLRLGRGVAVKTLRSDLAGDAESLARFRSEARSAASLNHPSIVAVYDTDEDVVDGAHVPYIVMERVDGSTFAALLHDRQPLPPAKALELTAGVLKALAHAHRSGIVHSDIKPANVMLTHDGAVKVTDFGIARLVAVQGADLPPDTTVIGTPPYLSPEQARGKAVGAPADLYSTGCLLYELLTGRPPFLGEGVLDLVLQHVEATPEPPSAHVPELSPECDALVLRALNKEPSDRPPNAEAMLDTVERVLGGLPSGTSDPEAAFGGPADAGGPPGPPASSPRTSGSSASSPAAPGLHTAPTLVFPAPDPPVRGDRGRRSRPVRRRVGRTAGLLVGALLAVVAGGYALTLPGSGVSDAAASAEASDTASPSSPAPDEPPEHEPGQRPADERTDGRQPKGERASGRGKARVPGLVGSTLPQARAAAERAGLRVVPAKRLPGRRCPEGSAEPGTVCAQTPKPGTGVARGTAIRVRVPEDRPRTHHRPARP
ncbi:protein kinase domain-containing protein [Streptomyces platensis]|uniref:protein kinase domain-containing protein n=1 Tax=Streptomyces platensis TaxID=58346 RepID=UPI001F23C914|nr:protein kinase [Streptomyces platensis]